MSLNDQVPSEAFDVLVRNMQDLDKIVNSTQESISLRGAPNGKSTSLTVTGLEGRYIATAINGGVWAAGIDFTAYNQYMVYLGVAYKAKFSTTLPYTSTATPDLAFVEPFSGEVSSSNFADIPFTVSGTSADRDLDERFGDIPSIKDYGAVGDGITDDSAAFTTVEGLTVPFVYLPEGTYVVTSVQLKKVYYGPGIIELDGTDREQALSNARPRTITVFPPITGMSNVLLDDGTWLDVSSSTTSGLQEAIDYACGDGTAGTGNLDLYIVGGEETTDGQTGSFGGAVVYNCTSGLVFPAMQGKKISSGAVTFNFTSAIGTTPAVRFNSMIMTDIDLAGAQIVNGGTGVTLQFQPEDGVPIDGGAFGVHSIIDCNVHITTVVNINDSVQSSSLGAVVRFVLGSAGATGIQNTSFVFEEINQQNTASGSACIWVDNATNNAPFANNYIKCLHNHNHTGVGVQMGTSTTHALYSSGNTYDIICNASSGASSDFNCFEDELTLQIANENTNADYGLVIQSSVTDCTIIAPVLVGGIAPIQNNATDKTSNKLISARPIVNATSITVGASPFIYQNTSLQDREVIVQSGSITSSTQFSHDGITFYDLGVNNGIFHLPRGMYIKVTYSSAPVMRYYET